MTRLEGEALLRLLEVRRALEDVVVRKAALNATSQQRVAIGRACKKLLKLVNAAQDWHRADADFHGAIYEASGNPVFGQILLNLDDAIKRSEESPYGRNEFGLESFPHHQILCDGLVSGDPELAAAGINRIVDSVAGEIERIIASQSN